MIRLRTVSLTASIALASPAATAQFLVPNLTDDGWDRGITPLSTYAEWDFFDSPTGPNAPGVQSVVGTLPEDAPEFDAFDANAPTSGSFITGGGNIYTFSGINTPVVISPGFGLGYGFKTTAIVQVRTLGVEPDQETFVLNSRRRPIEIIELDRTDVGGGFGGTQLDTLVRFEFARNDLAHEVLFEAESTSLSFDKAAIDTFVEPMDCPVDLDLNDAVDFFDVLEFLKDVDADDGDWNTDGETNAEDIVECITEAEAGCEP